MHLFCQKTGRSFKHSGELADKLLFREGTTGDYFALDRMYLRASTVPGNTEFRTKTSSMLFTGEMRSLGGELYVECLRIEGDEAVVSYRKANSNVPLDGVESLLWGDMSLLKKITFETLA